MKKAVIGVFLSNLTGAGLGFLVNVALARLLDLASFGRINLLFSLITIMYTVADFGFTNSLVIYCNRRRGGEGNGPAGAADAGRTGDRAAPAPAGGSARGVEAIRQVNRFYLRFLAAATLLGLLALPLCGALYRLTMAESVTLFFSFLLFSGYRYLSALHQARGEWRSFNLLTVLNNVLKCAVVLAAVGAAALLFPLFPRYQAALWGYLAYSLLLFLVCAWLSRRLLGLGERFTPEQRREFLELLYPIGIAGIFIIVTMRFDSLLIERVLGSEQLGIYAAANTLALVFPLITGSLMNVLIRESAGDQDRFLGRVMANQRKYLLALGGVLAAAWLLAAPVVGLLFGSGYLPSLPVFRILLIAYIGGLFFTPLESYYYANHPKTILWMRLVQMLAVVVSCLVLIGPLRLEGVAVSIVASRVIAWVYFYARSLRIITASGGAA